MMQTIYIQNQKYQLNAADLIQSGGEGMVFGLGNTAVKLYHQPTPAYQNKLGHWFTQRWQLPPDVLAPCAPVHDKNGAIIGLQMARLPAAQPFKRLSQPSFWQQHALATRQIMPLLQRLHQTLGRLHQLQIVVGDLNETNIFFTLPGANGSRAFWIDVDSYQFGPFPCPVAMPAFLDPTLYHITNFGKRPYFTPLTDWYAFTVLLVKSLLQVHPYGGVHRQHKTVQARAAAQVSLFNSSVTLPPRARPPETLSDDLLHHLHSMFERGERQPFPAHLLHQYAQNLRTCPHCNLDFPGNRSGCPACRHPTPVPGRSPTSTGLRTLLRVDGFIEAVFVQPNGRLLIITRQEEQAHLVRAGIGGLLNEAALFSGAPGYRFGAFTRPDGHDFLVVNPPHRPQLLLLDIHTTAPKQITLLETALFRETAVFATTPHYLYRISGGWIMRGSVQRGSYMEEPIGTAHQAQTQLFGDPHGDRIAGFHRIFARHRFFTIGPDGTERPLLATQPPDAHLIQSALLFAPQQIGVAQQLTQNGRTHTHVQAFNHRAQWQQSWDLGADDWETAVNQFPFFQTSFPQPLSPGDRLHFHPAGWLIQQPQQLSFLPHSR